MTKPLTFSDAHAAGLCSVAYVAPAPGSGGGEPTLVTAGPDGRICYRPAGAPGGAPTKEAANANNGAPAAVHCLATAPGRPVVAGDEQNFVKVGSSCLSSMLFVKPGAAGRPLLNTERGRAP